LGAEMSENLQFSLKLEKSRSGESSQNSTLLSVQVVAQETTSRPSDRLLAQARKPL